MSQFLRETWEMWYWLLFHPAKMRERRAVWTSRHDSNRPGPKDVYDNRLLSQANRRLAGQFTLLLALQLLPLLLVIVVRNPQVPLAIMDRNAPVPSVLQGLKNTLLVPESRPTDWLLLPMALLGAYGIGVYFRSLGLHFPLLLLLTYVIEPATLQRNMSVVLQIFPKYNPTAYAMVVSTGGILITCLISFGFLRHGRLESRRTVLIAGTALSVALAAWYSTGVWLLALLSGGLIALLLTIVRSVLRARSLNNIKNLIAIAAFGVAFSIASALASMGMNCLVQTIPSSEQTAKLELTIGLATAILIVFGIASGIAIISTDSVVSGIRGGITGGIGFGIMLILISGIAGPILGLAKLELNLFLLVGWFIGACLAPVRGRWHGLIIAGVLAILGLEQHHWSTLLVVPITLLGYYRLLPEYPIFAMLSTVQTTLLAQGRQIEPLSALRALPPHTSELLWLPLPGHHKLLAAAFHDDSTQALETLQLMRNTRQPGFRRTIHSALPHIVAEQLLAVRSLMELVDIATPELRILPMLVPTLYQDIEPNDEQRVRSTAQSVKRDEIAVILSRLRAIARGIGIPLSVGSSFTQSTSQDDIALILTWRRAIARDIEAALSAGSPFLRKRSLEHCLTKMERMKGQLPGLDLDNEIGRLWWTVLEHWQALVRADIEQQRPQTLEEVINPFQSGNPLQPKCNHPERNRLFKGRQSFADTIVCHLLEHGRPTLVLYGPRRCGKSSFLLNLPRLLRSDIVPVYLDVQNSAATASAADFCYSLVRAITCKLKLPTPPGETLSRTDFVASPYTALEDWLDRTLPTLETRRLLLCLDEFEKLKQAVGRGFLDMQLFDTLRHLIQHRDELSFLLCGVQTLDELAPEWSSYFISVRPIEMTYLEVDEARALLEDPDSDFELRYADGIVERVLEETNRQPYLLQLVGEEMVTQANQHHTRTITQRLLERALEAALAAGEPYFSNVWSECTGTSAEEIRAGQALLRMVANKQPLVLDGALTQAALRRLERYHVLARPQGVYSFEVPLIARWVRERAAFT